MIHQFLSRWTIRARVASKPSVRTWSNSRGEGRVLNVDLLDETVSYSLTFCQGPLHDVDQFLTFLSFQGEIRASCFNETADKFAAIFELGKVAVVHCLIVVT